MSLVPRVHFSPQMIEDERQLLNHKEMVKHCKECYEEMGSVFSQHKTWNSMLKYPIVEKYSYKMNRWDFLGENGAGEFQNMGSQEIHVWVT